MMATCFLNVEVTQAGPGMSCLGRLLRRGKLYVYLYVKHQKGWLSCSLLLDKTRQARDVLSQRVQGE